MERGRGYLDSGQHKKSPAPTLWVGQGSFILRLYRRNAFSSNLSQDLLDPQRNPPYQLDILSLYRHTRHPGTGHLGLSVNCHLREVGGAGNAG